MQLGKKRPLVPGSREALNELKKEIQGELKREPEGKPRNSNTDTSSSTPYVDVGPAIKKLFKKADSVLRRHDGSHPSRGGPKSP